MSRTTLALSLIAAAIAAPAHAAMLIPGRIVMGTSTTAIDGFPRFFATGGFANGNSSHTNTVSFDDGVGKVEYNITVEAFNAAGPAGLNVGVGATGVELGVDNTRIDAGESIKVTYNSITHSQIDLTPGTIDPASWLTTLNAIHFNSFDDGTDTYTYTGVGAGGAVGDDSFELALDSPIDGGDTFTIEGDSGAFKLQWLSHMTEYELGIPEPSSFAVAVLGLIGVATSRRKS